MSNPHTTRQEQAAWRREQLLETALALFSERGYRATSVREITRRAGVTEGLLYHYFSGKAELLTAVLARYAPFASYGQIIEDAAEAPVDAVLTSLGEQFLRLLRERQPFVLTLLSEAPHDPELGGILGVFLRRSAQQVVDFLAARQAAGQIGATVDIEVAAQAFQGGLLLHFLASVLQAPTTDADDAAIVRRQVALLLAGLRPTPPDATP